MFNSVRLEKTVVGLWSGSLWFTKVLWLGVAVFTDKTLIITGGTGSFGNAMLSRLLDTSIRQIRIFSRDEKKQEDMRRLYRDQRLKFIVGDVRDCDAISVVMDGCDFCLHAAALKQVPSCEFYPMEAVKTNVVGTENVLAAALSARVRVVVCLSTDKAVYPINAMGMSKALMEKVMVATARNQHTASTIICGTRYGNVIASRGSVVPLFVEQLLASQPITITDADMTRFLMTLDDAIDLVHYAFANGRNGDIFVQKSPASSIGLIASALKSIFDRREHPIHAIGPRHGEKLHELLLSREERARADDLGRYFRIPMDCRDLRYDTFVDVGDASLSEFQDYSSSNTTQLSEEELVALLGSVPLIQHALSKRLSNEAAT